MQSNTCMIAVRETYRYSFDFLSHLLVLSLFVTCVELGITHGNIISDDLFNYCLDGMYHKSAPGPESSLYNQCNPWKNRACCTHNTTERIHDLTLYQSINYTQCQPLSESCKEYFIRDSCFYECSPNIGPWVEKVGGIKTRRERFKNVPLCKTDCDNWFNACKNDNVCSRNWIADGRCTDTSYCVSIEQTYQTAQNFCEEIWDHSWMYTSDDKPCMKMWFDPLEGNPNDAVTLTIMKPKQYSGKVGSATILLVFLSLLSVLFIVCFLIRNECALLRNLLKLKSYHVLVR